MLNLSIDIKYLAISKHPYEHALCTNVSSFKKVIKTL